MLVQYCDLRDSLSLSGFMLPHLSNACIDGAFPSSDRTHCEMHQTQGPAFSPGLCTAQEQLPSLRVLIHFS